MYERRTRQSRAVIANAQAAAQTYNHDYVGTEHILLALSRDASGSALLAELGVDESAVRAAIERHQRATPAPEPPASGALTTSG